MSRSPLVPSPHVPRAYLDPVGSAAEALAVIHLAMRSPLVPELVAFMLDTDGRGGHIVAVSDVDDDDAVLRVVDLMCRVAADHERLCSLVVASVRPHGGADGVDARRWRDADRLAADHGIELVEWFVISPDGAECPRELAGDESRW